MQSLIERTNVRLRFRADREYTDCYLIFRALCKLSMKEVPVSYVTSTMHTIACILLANRT
jgi:hypothetical protein